MNKLYEKLALLFNGSRELVSISCRETFKNANRCYEEGSILYSNKKNDVLQKRKSNELHFHNFLEHQLFSRLQEIKYYSEVNILDTRRLVATSADCISMVQILVRDKIHLIVHFRSSDFDGALPVDLEWISSLPSAFINHLIVMKNEPGYEEVSSNTIEKLLLKEVSLDITFGSLHRTVDERQKSLF